MEKGKGSKTAKSLSEHNVITSHPIAQGRIKLPFRVCYRFSAFPTLTRVYLQRPTYLEVVLRPLYAVNSAILIHSRRRKGANAVSSVKPECTVAQQQKIIPFHSGLKRGTRSVKKEKLQGVKINA
jgi:hypothetical protein